MEYRFEKENNNFILDIIIAMLFIAMFILVVLDIYLIGG